MASDPVEWICSGVPTQQPVPERQTADLLRERDLLLFSVEQVEQVELSPRTRSRRLIGYVTRDPEVLRLALMLADVGTAAPNMGCDHPMVMAARWVQAGYTADAAVRWVTAGAAWDPPLSPGVRTATMDP